MGTYNEYYADVDYTAPNNFIVIGWWMWYGYFHRTTVFGKSWISDYTTDADGVVDEFSSVSFGDNSTGILVGFFGHLAAYTGYEYGTTNGGKTWQRHNSPNLILKDVYLINNLVGIIVGGSSTTGAILKTTNGGINWIYQKIAITARMQGIYLITTTMAIAIGFNGTILRTTDGGVTWNKENSGITNWLNRVTIRDSMAIAVGDSGTILKKIIHVESVDTTLILTYNFKLEQNYPNPFN